MIHMVKNKNATMKWSKCTIFTKEVAWLVELSNKGTKSVESKIEPCRVRKKTKT